MEQHYPRSPIPFQVGSDADAERYHARVRDLVSRLPPGTFAVAPLMNIDRTVDGVRLQAEQRVTPEMLLPDLNHDGHIAACSLQRFRRLVARGWIVEAI